MIVWDATYEPFGKIEVGTAEIENNLRLPGQYADEETGLHYNYFRDYDPSVGRYVESDPIGLGGGLNTYNYALSNPIYYVDPTGENPGAAVGCAVGTPIFGPIGCGAGAAVGGAINLAAGVYIAYRASRTQDDECNDDDCMDLYQKINVAVNGLERRYRQIRENRGSINPSGHILQFTQRQANLRKLLQKADMLGCTNYRKDAWNWATMESPTSSGRSL